MHPRGHLVQDLQQLEVFHEHRKDLVHDVKVQLGPPTLEGLTEVDPDTSLPSGVPISCYLPCSMTQKQLHGTQELGCLTKGSSTDQDGGSSMALV